MTVRSFDEIVANPEIHQWTCPDHGTVYGTIEGRNYITWECPDCEREAQKARHDFDRQHVGFRRWLNSSGVPVRYRSATADRIVAKTPSAKALRTWATGYVDTIGDKITAGEGSTLLGPPGLGKTVGLAAAVNGACAAGYVAVYRSWPDVIADIKSGFNGPRDDPRRTLIDWLSEVPLLALDELGVKHATDFEAGELFRLIDSRYANQLATLTAANSTKAGLAGLVGERVADRLMECGPTITLTGESERGRLTCSGPPALVEPPKKLTTRVHGQGVWRERVTEAPKGGGENWI